MGQQLGIEVRLELGDQSGTLLVPELLQQVRLIGGMERARELRRALGLAGLERLLDGADEFLGRPWPGLRSSVAGRGSVAGLGHGRIILARPEHRPRRAPTG